MCYKIGLMHSVFCQLFLSFVFVFFETILLKTLVDSQSYTLIALSKAFPIIINPVLFGAKFELRALYLVGRLSIT
jgi:hypothetical protein